SSPRRLDMIGVALLTVGAALITGPLALGPGLGWPPQGWATLAVGVAVLAGFTWWQYHLRRIERSPLLDPTILSVRGMGSGLAALLLSSTSYTGILYCVAAQLQDHHQASPLAAGLDLLPFAVGFGLGSVFGSVVPPDRHRALVVAGLVALGGGMVGLAAVTWAGGWPAVPAGLLLGVAGLGYGASFSPLIGLTVAHVDHHRVADASGISTTTFQFSFVLGVAAFGSVFTATGIGVALTAMSGLALLAIVPVAGWLR
ncbi:MAG TPA: hypothetical protein VGD84_04665, partial [Pseudonocardiaceae bacterium]